MTRIRLVAVFALAVTLASCGTSSRAEPETVKVAFIVDLSGPDALEHVLPARQGAELAFRIAQITRTSDVMVELVELDIAADPEILQEIEGDPAFVAVVVAPTVDAEASIARSNVPVVSLSGLGPAPPQNTAWLRLVAPLEVVADTVAGHAANSPTCILSDVPVPDDLGELLDERLGGGLATIEPASANSVVERSDCTNVSWVGSPDGGAAAARALEGSGVAFSGGDRLLGPDFIDDAGSAAEGARSICSCADVSSSLDLDVQRFIQDYQARFGSAPGAYAVEGWDAANLLLQAFREGEPTRGSVQGFLGGLASVEGLVGVYRFTPDGELVDPANHVVTYLALGGRWTLAGAQPPG
ncbi:MAG: ABC transporter substrate-binding protein [Actinomycetota bacterium]